MAEASALHLASPHTPLPTLHPTLLDSGYVPSERDKATVNRAIEDAKVNLSTIDEEILALQESLARLQSRRTQVEEYIATHQAVLAPIRRLPPEILSEIFLFAAAEATISWPHVQPVGDAKSMSGNGACDANTVPWRLGAVCSLWRATLVSLPKLWSTIYLRISPGILPHGVGTQELTRRVLRFLDTCLARAGNELISFTLEYQTGASSHEDPSRELVCAALVRLVEASERWASVKLDLENLFSFHSLLAPALDRVPNIHTLYLASSGQCTTAPRPWHAIHAFHSAPRLRNLTLVRISHPTHHLHLPWNQLKTLRSQGSHFHEGEFTRLLKQCEGLEELKTEDERVLDMALTTALIGTSLPQPNASPAVTTSTAPNSAVYLPQLRSLTIINKGSYISRIFQLLTAPSLTSLSIHSRTPYSAEHTIAMLRRSNCSQQLRSLSLETSKDMEVVWEENYGLVCLLAETRGVEEVALKVSKAADEIVPRLTVKRGMGGGSPVLAPSLPMGYGMGMGAYGGVSVGYGSVYQSYGGMSSRAVASGGTTLLPNLRRFALEDSFCVSVGELKEMLQSRMGVEKDGHGSGVARLERVELKLSRPAPPSYEELDIVREFGKEAGTEVILMV